MSEVLNKVMVDFTKQEPLVGYRCTICGAGNCKLWRHPFGANGRLFCVGCAGIDQHEDTSRVDKNGCHRHGMLNNYNRIGRLIPAVPGDENGSFCVENGASRKAQEWWRSLPTREPC